jgi:hypothetical protein
MLVKLIPLGSLGVHLTSTAHSRLMVSGLLTLLAGHISYSRNLSAQRNELSRMDHSIGLAAYMCLLNIPGNVDTRSDLI